MKYYQEHLFNLYNHELNNLCDKKFHFKFLNKKVIKPNDNQTIDGVFIIHKTTTSGNFSLPAGLISGFIIRELKSDIDNFIDFSNIEHLTFIE